MTVERKAGVGSVEFVVLMAFIMLLTGLAIDIMLPTFDDVRAYLGLGQESTAVAQIVTFFLLGQIGQIVFGTLSDRTGRLPVMRFGFGLYILGCIAAALLPNINLILAARFATGLGASAMSVTAVATVRDRFEGDQMARTMALIMTIFLGVPILAPTIGSVILSVSSWQVVFLTPPVIAIVVFFWSLRLRESLVPEKRRQLDAHSLATTARQIVSNRTFVRYTLVTTTLFAAFSSYIGSSERIIGTMYGHHELFTTIFASVGATMLVVTFFNAQFIRRYGSRRVVRGVISLYLIVAIILLVITLANDGKPNLFVFFGFVAVLQAVYVAANPNSSALALKPLGSAAGMAAAFYGTTYLTIGSILGSFIDRSLVDSVVPLAVAYVIGGLIAAALVHSDRSKAAAVEVNEVEEEVFMVG